MLALRLMIVLVLLPLGMASAAAQACPGKEVINCGHRGTGENDGDNPFPENTLPSFTQGEIEGATMIELDVMHSADGAVVVIHDDKVDDTTDGTGCVGDMSLAQLQALDAGFGTSMQGMGVTIPTLSEALASISVDVNVEIKLPGTASCPDADRAQLAADVVAAIAADRKDRRVIVGSFDVDVLDAVRALDANLYIALISFIADDATIAAEHGFDSLNMSVASVRGDTVDAIHAMGLDVAAWTENDGPSMQLFLDYGVDMIITDEPDVFTAARNSWCENYVPPPEDGGGCCSSSNGGAGSALLALGFLFAFVRRR